MAAKYKYLFGPVPSRRLGISLGVDLIPHKICTLNCVYCECGRTTKLTRERGEYVSFEEVCNELDDYFSHNPDPEFITFSGAGEPTLHSRIGEVIHHIKRLRPAVPLAVLTNGTLLWDPEVRDQLATADLVLPSLDAATEGAFRKINRPERDFTIETYIQGLVDFGSEFKGEVWLEVLIIPGYNDDEENISALREVIGRIGPHRVQLNTLDRPGTLEGLKPASWTELERIAGSLGTDRLEIIAPPPVKPEQKPYRSDVERALLETLERRPCTMEDLQTILGVKELEILKHLDHLEKSGKITTSRQERGLFYHRKDQQ